MKILTFDIEIKNKIPNKYEEPNPHYQYCNGWGDYVGMGISFLGAHCSWTDKILFFDDHNLPEFLALIQECDILTGYNIIQFDIPLLLAVCDDLGYTEQPAIKPKVYDPFSDIRASLYGRMKGWKLDDVAKATLGFTKNGDGAMAPDLWQDKKYAELINYLAQDVRVESALFQHIWQHGSVTNGKEQVILEQIKPIQKEKQNEIIN